MSSYTPRVSHDRWDLIKPLAVVYGVPIGILVGAVVAAVFDVTHVAHPVSWGVIAGLGSGIFGGALWAVHQTDTRFEFEARELRAPCLDWDRLIERLNVRAASKRYLVIRNEMHYVAYTPTMAAPVGGPLTLSSGRWLCVVVTWCEQTVTIAGPKWIVAELVDAAGED